MEIPIEIVVALLVLVSGIFATIAGFGFRYLLRRVERNEDKIENYGVRIHKRIDGHHNELISSLEKMTDKLVSLPQCEATEKLWDQRFKFMMEANAKDIKSLKEVVVGLADEISELSSCVDKLIRGKTEEC